MSVVCIFFWRESYALDHKPSPPWSCPLSTHRNSKASHRYFKAPTCIFYSFSTSITTWEEYWWYGSCSLPVLLSFLWEYPMKFIFSGHSLAPVATMFRGFPAWVGDLEWKHTTSLSGQLCHRPVKAMWGITCSATSTGKTRELWCMRHLLMLKASSWP